MHPLHVHFLALHTAFNCLAELAMDIFEPFMLATSSLAFVCSMVCVPDPLSNVVKNSIKLDLFKSLR